jgi:magnesium transporter
MGALLGIVTVDDVLDVIQEETTEDIHKFGGLEALEQPYMQVRFFSMLRKRALWLAGLFCAQLLTLHTMGFFSRRIEQAVALVLFVPTIISSGGNSGSQAATLVVRAMALHEVTARDWWRVLRREVLFGTILGGLLATLGFVRILIGDRLGEGIGAEWAPLGVGVGLSLLAVVVWGVLIGSMLPFLLRRLGFDPATSSAPFVATIVDVTGVVIYFAIATSFVG